MIEFGVWVVYVCIGLVGVAIAAGVAVATVMVAGRLIGAAGGGIVSGLVTLLVFIGNLWVNVYEAIGAVVLSFKHGRKHLAAFGWLLGALVMAIPVSAVVLAGLAIAGVGITRMLQ